MPADDDFLKDFSSLNDFHLNTSQFFGSNTVMEMSTDEKAWYLLLLVKYWNGKCRGLTSAQIPHRNQNRIHSGIQRTLRLTFFKGEDGRWHNKEARRRWERAYRITQAMSEGGKNSARVRALHKNSTRPLATPPLKKMIEDHPPSLNRTRKEQHACHEGKKRGLFQKKIPKREELRVPETLITAVRSEVPALEELTERELHALLAMAARLYRESGGKKPRVRNPWRALLSNLRYRDPSRWLRGVTGADESWAQKSAKKLRGFLEPKADIVCNLFGRK